MRATGIDQIIAEASVAKATFYYHFPSKTVLVQAYLDQRHTDWLQEFEAYLRAVGRTGLAPLADALERWFMSGAFNGCAFINITAESAEEEWRKVSSAHKDALLRLIETRLRSIGASPRAAATAAAQALLVIEGMIVRFQMTQDTAIVSHGRNLLATIEAGVGGRSKHRAKNRR